MSYPMAAAVIFLVCAALGVLLCRPLIQAHGVSSERRETRNRRDGVGIGTVRSIADPITVDVESISGQRFVGRLRPHTDTRTLAALRPGVVLLVTFDPSAREELSLADDIVAVRAAFDQMLVRKGLVTPGQMDLIRHGTKSRGVVTAMRTTGSTCEDYREVELDLMVRRPAGGQFPAHEIALVPATALHALSPGAVIDTYYRHGDETAVAVCVPG